MSASDMGLSEIRSMRAGQFSLTDSFMGCHGEALLKIGINTMTGGSFVSPLMALDPKIRHGDMGIY